MVYQTSTEPVQKDTWHDVLVAFGGNQPLSGMTPPQVVRSAIKELKIKGFDLKSSSRIYRTPAFPENSGPDYANAVVFCRVHKSPDDVLAAAAEIEGKFFRKRENRWGARTLDIDILSYDDTVIPDLATFERWRNLPPDDQQKETPTSLILPHPRIQDRAFVLVPMMDVAPDWRHPVLGKTTRQLLADLPAEDVAAVCPVDA